MASHPVGMAKSWEHDTQQALGGGPAVGHLVVGSLGASPSLAHARVYMHAEMVNLWLCFVP